MLLTVVSDTLAPNDARATAGTISLSRFSAILWQFYGPVTPLKMADEIPLIYTR